MFSEKLFYCKVILIYILHYLNVSSGETADLKMGLSGKKSFYIINRKSWWKIWFLKIVQVMLSTPQNLGDPLKKGLMQCLVDMLHVQGVCMVQQSLLALYSYNATSGIIVDIGHRIEILPIFDGMSYNWVQYSEMSNCHLSWFGGLRNKFVVMKNKISVTYRTNKISMKARETTSYFIQT